MLIGWPVGFGGFGLLGTVSGNGFWNSSEYSFLFFWDCLEEYDHFVAYGIWYLICWGLSRETCFSERCRHLVYFFVFGIVSKSGLWNSCVFVCCGTLEEYAHFVAYGFWYFWLFWDCLERYVNPGITRHFLRKNGHVHKHE